MTGTTIREYLPVMADIFAQYAAVAALLWFDPPFDVTEVEARCQRAMRGALESKELQALLSEMEDSTFDPDAAESSR